ncbi:hypothetical protein [Sorangium sp. So ce124]|uniref:hypothetical protein n=1 Tax=Sorangium sp. So ce124 TaxID=3133280 RepID=UPI003F5EBBF9
MISPACRARWPRAFVLSLCLLAPATVRAQPVARRISPAVQALYEQANDEMDAMRYESACPRLEEVIRLAPDALGAKLTLGACYEGWGKLASAWSQYVLVEGAATKVGDLDRRMKAAVKAAALKPKLATLTIDVPASVRPIPGLTITRDGLPVREAQWSVPLPLDVGRHEMVVSGRGYKTRKQPIEIGEDGDRVAVSVLPLESMTNAGPGPERPWQRPAAIVAMGLGGAGLVAGAVLGGMAIARNQESNDGHCNAQERCDPTGLDLRRQAVGLGKGSTVALVAGGLLAAGGVALFVTAPSHAQRDERARPSGAQWRAEIALRPGGVAVQGGW